MPNKELLDFGTGALTGAATGATIGTAIAPGLGTAIGAGVGGLGMGLISLFGDSDDDITDEYNRQQIELGRFDLADKRRQDKLARQKQKKMDAFGTAFSQYLSTPAQGGA